MRHQNSFLGSFENPGNGERDAAPAFGFRIKLTTTRFGQAIVFRAAIVFRVSPEGGDPALVLHAMESGKKGAGLDDESSAGDLFNAARDAEAVHFASSEGFEDQEIEGSLQQGGGFGRQSALLSRVDRIIGADL